MLRRTTRGSVRALLATSVLMASLALIAVSAPAAAGGGCTYKMAQQPGYDSSGAIQNIYVGGEVSAGEVVCGGAGRDYVGEIFAGGEFRGRRGDDTVGTNNGSFKGGPGHDQVVEQESGAFRAGNGRDEAVHVHGGVFVGDRGNDRVELMDGGRFRGGKGADRVTVQHGDGHFIGGAWKDRVQTLHGGTVHAGTGRDLVVRQYGGLYAGGPQWDRLDNACGGTRKSVEKVQPIGAC